MWNIPTVVHTSFTLHLYNVTKAGRKIRYYSILLLCIYFIVLHFICICCLYSTLLSTYVFPLMRLVQPFFVDFIYGFCYYIFDISCMFKIIYGHAVLIHNSYIPSTLLTYYLLLPILTFFLNFYLGVILKPCGPLGGGGFMKSPQGGRGGYWYCPRGPNILGFRYIFFNIRTSFFLGYICK